MRGDSCVMSAGGDRARVAEELARQQEQENAGAGGCRSRRLLHQGAARQGTCY